MASSAIRQAYGKFRVVALKLPWTVGSRELRDHFSQFGRLKFAQVHFDQNTGMSRGYGFVEFINERSLDEVLSTQHKIDGEEIRVNIADEERSRNRGGGGGFNRSNLRGRAVNIIDKIDM